MSLPGRGLSELALVLVGSGNKDFYNKEIERYKLETAEIKLAADKLEAEATEWDRKSDSELHVHHRWAALRSRSPWPPSRC